ncbi:PIH1 domain-containing protein 2 [Melanotaenia boesemani]|uniref:PIH1 domain-containing protein 2 n=1 Tax=Melanotaenia boesemani TaxID=1250792 RepID=UPI001C05A4FF|nr:PIH1 domain-containing protein 2 [Melanotaenia boesemani]
MPFTGSTENVLQQVNQFWAMLDDLSENDPAAYRKLIEKQMKERAEFSSPPVLHSCVRTQMLEPKTGLLYINICSWKCVPAPQDLSSPLSVCAGNLETGTDENQGWFAVLDLALNPAVLQESNADKTDINKVYVLALSFAQQQHGMRLSQEYNVVNCSPKSSPGDLHHRLGFQTQPNTSTQTETASQTPGALLRQISSLRSVKQDEVSTSQIISKPTEHIKKDLIQVISTAFVEPQKPEYQMEVKTDTVGVPCSMELTVELPKVRSMSECQLRVSKEDVLLEVDEVYYLLLDWPNTVNEDTASAIFNKKKRRLRLKVDVL